MFIIAVLCFIIGIYIGHVIGQIGDENCEHDFVIIHEEPDIEVSNYKIEKGE